MEASRESATGVLQFFEKENCWQNLGNFISGADSSGTCRTTAPTPRPERRSEERRRKVLEEEKNYLEFFEGVR